jgi:hypothetical protein
MGPSPLSAGCSIIPFRERNEDLNRVLEMTDEEEISAFLEEMSKTAG